MKSAFYSMLLAVLSIPSLAQFFIDPVKGNDKNNGSNQVPFKTIGWAKDFVKKKNLTDDVIIFLRGGIYPVTQSILFDEHSGGRDGHKIIFKAYNSEVPVLDAGIQINNWKKAGAKLWKARIANVENFRQLYVNDVRANRARSNMKYTGSGWPNPYTSFVAENWELKKQYYPEGIKVSRNVLDTTLGSPKDIELVWIGEESKCTWKSHRLLVNSLLEEGDSIIIILDNYCEVMTSHDASAPFPQSPFYLENAFEFLDEPGEWYFSRQTKELFYYPRAGESMQTTTAFIPGNVETILSIKGSSLSRKVNNIEFDGLVFRHTTWMRPSTSRLGACTNQADKYIKVSGQIGRAHRAINRKEFFYDPAYDFVVDADGEAEGFKPDACVEIDAAENISFKNCRFEHLGAVGIDMLQGCNNISIEGNVFRDLSATSIVIGRWDQDFIGPGEEVCKAVTIRNNYITKIGAEYYNSPGITAFFTDSLVVQHNEIVDLPYSGISSGWGSWKGKTDWTTSNRRNLIEFNRISNFCQLCSDGGGIYTIGIGKSRTDPDTLTSKIRFNYIDQIGYAYGALYPDEGSCFYELRNNVLEEVETSPKGKWLHLWSRMHHDMVIDGNYSNSKKFLNKGVNTPLSNHYTYEGKNRPPPAETIIKQAGLEPNYDHLRNVNALKQRRWQKAF